MADDLLELFLQASNDLLRFVALLLGPIIEFVRRHNFSVAQGANASPIGVRNIAMPLAAAFSWSAENASACFDWKA